MKSLTIEDFVDWIEKNRTGCAFRGYDRTKILMEILSSMKECVFSYTLDHEGNITGVVCGRKFAEKKIIYIYDILTTSKEAIKHLLLYCYRLYPDYEIHGAVASGRPRVFKSVGKLLRRI